MIDTRDAITRLLEQRPQIFWARFSATLGDVALSHVIDMVRRGTSPETVAQLASEALGETHDDNPGESK